MKCNLIENQAPVWHHVIRENECSKAIHNYVVTPPPPFRRNQKYLKHKWNYVSAILWLEMTSDDIDVNV